MGGAHMKLKFCLLLLVVAAVLAGCGAMSPDADAGDDQTVTLGETATLSAANSDERNSDSLTYDWSITSAPTGSTAELSDPHAKNPTFTPDLIGKYVFQLIVDNDYHESDPATVTITCVKPGSTTQVQNATDSTETIFLYDLTAVENSRDTDAGTVNFSLTYTLSNTSDPRADITVDVYALDADGNEVYSYEIQAGIEAGEERFSSIPQGDVLTIDEYGSIEEWQADPIVVVE